MFSIAVDSQNTTKNPQQRSIAAISPVHSSFPLHLLPACFFSIHSSTTLQAGEQQHGIIPVQTVFLQDQYSSPTKINQPIFHATHASAIPCVHRAGGLSPRQVSSPKQKKKKKRTKPSRSGCVIWQHARSLSPAAVLAAISRPAALPSSARRFSIASGRTCFAARAIPRRGCHPPDSSFVHRLIPLLLSHSPNPNLFSQEIQGGSPVIGLISSRVVTFPSLVVPWVDSRPRCRSSIVD